MFACHASTASTEQYSTVNELSDNNTHFNSLSLSFSCFQHAAAAEQHWMSYTGKISLWDCLTRKKKLKKKKKLRDNNGERQQ